MNITHKGKKYKVLDKFTDGGLVISKDFKTVTNLHGAVGRENWTPIEYVKDLQIIFFDGYDEVRDANTHDVIFSTKIPDSIKEYFDRTTIEPTVIDNVVTIWNKDADIEDVDEYLLDEGKCCQEEREVIIESLHEYAYK